MGHALEIFEDVRHDVLTCQSQSLTEATKIDPEEQNFSLAQRGRSPARLECALESHAIDFTSASFFITEDCARQSECISEGRLSAPGGW
jgi:hypothetical protein